MCRKCFTIICKLKVKEKTQVYIILIIRYVRIRSTIALKGIDDAKEKNNKKNYNPLLEGGGRRGSRFGLTFAATFAVAACCCCCCCGAGCSCSSCCCISCRCCCCCAVAAAAACVAAVYNALLHEHHKPPAMCELQLLQLLHFNAVVVVAAATSKTVAAGVVGVAAAVVVGVGIVIVTAVSRGQKRSRLEENVNT